MMGDLQYWAWGSHMLPRLMKSVPTGDAVLCSLTLPFVVLAWFIAIIRGHPQEFIAAAAFTVAAAVVAVRRTHLFASFVVTYAAFGILVITGSTDALGIFPLIACVPLTICAVTEWAPNRWPGWVATAVACVAIPLSPAVNASYGLGAMRFQIGLHIALIVACYLWSSRRRIQREARDRQRDNDVEFAQLSERQRIAADLHEGLGHALTAIRAKASTAEAMATTDPERAVEALRVISNLSKESLVDLRHTLGEMSENSNDDRAHDIGSLADLLARTRHLDLTIACTLPTHTDIDAIDARLSARTRVAVFRTMQEAITNIVRHNQPGVAVTMNFEIRKPFSKGETLMVHIENELTGPPKPSVGGGLGIENMRRRIADLGGRCRAQRVGETFVVDIEAPTLKAA